MAQQIKDLALLLMWLRSLLSHGCDSWQRTSLHATGMAKKNPQKNPQKTKTKNQTKKTQNHKEPAKVGEKDGLNCIV